MILVNATIRSRLTAGEIFKVGTWQEDCVKEASYALRVAHDFCMLDGHWYEADGRPTTEPLKILPGKIAILSTVERFDMPADLVGTLGMRLAVAAEGLTGLWGIQVDPWYGNMPQQGHDRLYVRLVNLGNEPIVVQPGDLVFNIEFQQLDAALPRPSVERPSTWLRLRKIGAQQQNESWTYVTHVESEVQERQQELQDRLRTEAKDIRDSLQPVVMFGVFLVAATLLSVSVAILLGIRDIPEATVPRWMTNWGWAVLMILLSVAAVATTTIGLATAMKAWRVHDETAAAPWGANPSSDTRSERKRRWWFR